MVDVASKIFPHSVFVYMFSGNNCSQHDGEIKPTFSWPFSYLLFSESHKGMKEGGIRDQISVIATVSFIRNLIVFIIYSFFPTQVMIKPPCFSTSDQPKNRAKNNQSVELII